MATYGFCGDKQSYLRKSWINWANLVVVAVEVLGYIATQSIPILNQLGVIKVTRVLYLVEMRYDKDRNMRLTIVGFWRLVPKIVTLLAVTIISYGFFALVLVKFYKNHFYYCDTVDLTTS